MRILGADVRELTATDGSGTVVALDATGSISALAPVEGVASLAREVARLAAGEPFLLAVDVAVQGAATADKPRRLERALQRRLGVRLPAPLPGAVTGFDLLAGLAAAGHPCLPYPDRDRRRSGLAEIHPEFVLKALIWEASAAVDAKELPDRESLLRAVEPPAYRGTKLTRAGWAARWSAVDAAARSVAVAAGFDVSGAREELQRAVTLDGVSRAASHLDASLLAGTAHRYVSEPERCAFVGERESGYVILPADAFVRRAALREAGGLAERARLFPQASLQQRLAGRAALKPLELLGIPGRGQHVEAVFEAPPLYEFDNLDEMLWWKHCRHLDGGEVPADGLRELVVRLDGMGVEQTLRLARSRHKTISFRFDPPQAWRAKVPPRDGRTYPFRILRAVYEVG
jgi:hypothetical protein